MRPFTSRFRARFALLLIVAFAFVAPLHAQQQAASRMPADAAPTKESDPKAYALGRVRVLAERIGELRDSTARARGFISLANNVCKFDKDLALISFLRGNEAIKLVADAEEQEKKQNPSERQRFSAANGLRSQMMAYASRCDTSFSAQLGPSPESGSAAGTLDSHPDLGAAMRLVDDPEKKDEAVRLASKAMESPAGERAYLDFASFLLRLRRQDPTTADQLFVQAVARLRAQPKPDGFSIMSIGNYLFTFVDVAKNPRFDDGYGMTTVGGVQAISLLYARPNRPSQVTRGFLEACADMLSRPTTEERLQKLDYATAIQLLPKARDLAPDLAPTFELVTKRSPAPPPAEASRLTRGFEPSEEEAESALEKETDPAKRQAMIYRLFSSAMDKPDVPRARKFAAELEDKEFRAQMLSLTDFAEAGKAAEEGRLDAALNVAKNLPSGAERGLMLANIAAAYIKNGDSRTALALLETAQREGDNVALVYRPLYLAGVTGVLARTDCDAALQLLQQTVATTNETDRNEKPGDRIFAFPRNPGGPPKIEAYLMANPGGFLKAAEYLRGARTYSLRTKNIEAFDLNPALLRLFAAEAERAEAIVLKLESETRLGPALAALAAAYLEAIPQPKKEAVKN